ncbi:peptidase A2A [Thiocystis violacea]|nr:peptidase A2A [Thiocystis violacea]
MLPNRWSLLALPMIGWSLALAAADESPRAPRVEVAVELERLRSEFGFEVRGIEQTEDAKAHSVDGSLLERLHLLLEDFDHVIVQSPGAGIERVIILGEKAAYVPPPMVVDAQAGGVEGVPPESTGDEIVLATQRRGSSHLVTLGLEGSNQQQIQESMLIDTGADRVVLPISLLSTLGLSTEGLQEQQVQTANGSVDARVGQLNAIWVGGKRVENVDVAFIDDQSLGGTSLLGMSLLGRFRMTIDDEKSQLTLGSK